MVTVLLAWMRGCEGWLVARESRREGMMASLEHCFFEKCFIENSQRMSLYTLSMV